MSSIGRPRDQAAHDAILKTALRLVTKRGFRGVSVNEIAAQAGVGKMTVYRHWPNKAALVMDSLLVLIGPETAFPEAGTAIERLRRQLDLQAAFFGGSRRNLIRSVVAEAQSDPVLAAAFRERWLNPRREWGRQIMRAGVAEGSLRSDLDIDAALDVLYGSFYYRLLVRSEVPDEHFVDAIYRQFIEGHGARR